MESKVVNWGTPGIVSVVGGAVTDLTEDGFTATSALGVNSGRKILFRTEDVLPPGAVPTKFKFSITFETGTGAKTNIRLAKSGADVGDYVHNYANSSSPRTVTAEDSADLYKLSSGNYDYGIEIYYFVGATPFTDKVCEFYDISLTIEYEIRETSKIFIGSSTIKEAYLGSQKLSGIYLGSNKLL